jgi:hypothetical protein
MPIFVLVIITWVFCGLLFVAAIVGSIVFFANRPGTGPRRVGRAIGMVCGGFLAFLLAAGAIAIPVVQQSREEGVRRNTAQRLREIGEQAHAQSDQVEMQRSEQTPKNADAGLKRLPEEKNPSATSGNASTDSGDGPRVSIGTKSPEWISREGHKEGDALFLVYASKRYSTLEEARFDVAQTVKKKLAEDFQRVYHRSSQFIFELPVNDIRRLAVRQEYLDPQEHDFGSFRAPMYAVWWQLELSPEVRTNLYGLWKDQAKEGRTLTVGGALLGITVALAGLSLLTRRRSGVMG